MFQENELVTLCIAIVVFIFIRENRIRLKKLPHSRLLIGSFYVYFAGWLCTVVEGVMLPDILNILEHLCYLGSSVLSGLWCVKVFMAKRVTA